jgi:hypothetical protein
MSDLVEFLLARIAEDEAVARDEYRCNTDMRWTPDRVLAECEKNRRIVKLHAIEVVKVPLPPFDSATGDMVPDEYDVSCEVCGWASDSPTSACLTLRLLALPYADHPDFDPGWPSGFPIKDGDE